MPERALALVALCAALVASPARAQQREDPVELVLTGIFGDEVLFADAYATVVATARNRTRQTFRGRVVVRADEYDQPPARNAIALDLPPLATRRVTMTFFVGANGPSLTGHYEEGGRTLGTASLATSYTPNGRSLVIVSDPPRLRPALLDLGVSLPTGTGTEEDRLASVPVGVASLDPQSGDPLLPDESLGWSSVALAIVSIPMLARTSERQLGALRDWVHAGGHLALVPRTPGDLDDPFVRELAGELRQDPARVLAPSRFVPLPPETPLPALDCGTRSSRDSLGCVASVGYGVVHVIDFDATGALFAGTVEVRALCRELAERALRAAGPPLAFGRRRDAFAAAPSFLYYDPTAPPSFATLRAALDPNEGYRPALGPIALVLLLYVVLVGPVNFAFVLRRNLPTLALLTTPALALGCAAVMLAAGYLGKGVTLRYRRIEIVTALEGATRAPARAYTSYFLTRPGSLDVVSPPRGLAMRLTSGRDDGLVTEHGGARPTLRGMHGGLWETIFLREDRVVDLGGGLALRTVPTPEGAERLAVLENRSGARLRGALLLDGEEAYAIGDVGAGESRDIGTNGQWIGSLVPDPYMPETPEASERLAAVAGLDPEEAVYLRGALGLVRAGNPVVWARIDAPPHEIAAGFSREQDLAFLVLEVRRQPVPGSSAPDESPLDRPASQGAP